MSRPAARLLTAIVFGGGRPLVDVVHERVSAEWPALGMSRADARRAVVAGAVRVNGQTCVRPGARLEAGTCVAVHADPSRVARVRRAGEAAPVAVVYEDAHLIAVRKPAGMPTHASADPQRPHVVGWVARHCGLATGEIGVHQRLDAATSGVLLFARSPVANRGLARAFADHAVEKVYLAMVDARSRPGLVAGHAWTARVPLASHGTGRRGRRVAPSPGGWPAVTEFVVLERRGDQALVQARPLTGRQHQIRSHLAAAGTPIVGDARYGGPPAAQLALHAWRLALTHPVTGERLTIEASPPAWGRRALKAGPMTARPPR